MKMNAFISGLPRALLLVFSVLSLASCGETVDKRRTTGYKGEAKRNAFLAAQRLLEKQDETVDFRSGIGGLDTTTSTLFLPPSSLNTVGRSKYINSWVENGGHLIVMISGGRKRGNDFRPADVPGDADDQVVTPGLEYLLEKLKVELVDWHDKPDVSAVDKLDRDAWEAMEEADRVLLGSEKISFSLGSQKMEIHHWVGKALEYDVDHHDEYGMDTAQGMGKHVYLSLPYGGGRVSLLADARPLRNRYIAYGDHARFVIELVGLSRDGAVVFVDGGGDHFFAMVWRYFWMAVLGLAVLIVFWLWKNLPRFGPLQDMPESEIREVSGQVRGIGRFLWRHKRDDAMLASLRGAVNRKLSLDADGSHQAAFEQLAHSTGLPVASVIEAMTRTHVREPGAMVRVVRHLQQILQTIN